MKVIRNINNNVAVCLDGDGNEVVAFGKGIGFKKAPYEIELSQIERTYYNLDTHNLKLLKEIPTDVLNITAEIVKKGSAYLGINFNNVFYFALADHINFAIENARKGIVLSNPLTNEIQYLYEKEMRLGNWAVKLINKKLGVKLASSEAGSIAIHFINAEQTSLESQEQEEETVFIESITDIIENELNIIVDRDNYNYTRFVTHLKYLYKRFRKQEQIETENQLVYQSVKGKFPELESAVKKINEFIMKSYGKDLSEEEMLYLMMHINRLCARDGL